MKVVIMAGGKGTRIASVNSEVPKPMLPVNGVPILEYQLEVLKKQGYRDIILIIGHLGNVIKEYFSDGKSFDVNIRYIEEKQPLGTAGALYYLKEELTEDFLLLNGDIIFDIDITRFMKYHKENGALATILTHPNNHPYDSGIIVADNKNRVTTWLHKEDRRKWYKNRVNAGIHMISPAVLKLPIFDDLQKIDLDREVLKPLIKKRQLLVYDSPEYVKDMGTPERYLEVEADIKAGKAEARNLSQKQKAVFLDRDGTINKYVGFLRNIEQMCLLPEAAQAIRKINKSGYLAIVVTNQPVLARGEVTKEELQEIHNKMETLLGQENAYLDAIYYCPHHPDKGYEGEVPELKIECSCRKPEPGLLLQAAKEYNIDLESSWMVGDSMNDILAGEKAGCKTILLTDKKNVERNTCSSILEAVDKIFKE